jgi:hypothetical protein
LAREEPERAANLLGAPALAVADRMEDALVAAVGYSQSSAAMLSTLDQFLQSATIERLAEVTGLSQSGGPARRPAPA